MSNPKKSNGEVSSPQAEACGNATSLGNILKTAGLLKQEQLEEALTYQVEHQDEMLGEILIKLGFITRDDFDAAMMKQRVMRSGFKRSEMRACFSIAKKRTDSFLDANDNLQKAALQLLQKLKAGS